MKDKRKVKKERRTMTHPAYTPRAGSERKPERREGERRYPLWPSDAAYTR